MASAQLQQDGGSASDNMFDFKAEDTPISIVAHPVVSSRQIDHSLPLLLSLIAGLGTCLGGLILLISLPASSSAVSKTHNSQKYQPVRLMEATSPTHTRANPWPLPPRLFGRLQALASGVMLL
ncbi:hypothetical protein HK102_013836, partial [Quaeritorhiza haematococci]